MKNIAFCGVLMAGAIAAASPASAQVTYDMSRVSCSDYQAMSPGDQRDFAAWTSGWFNGKQNKTEINFKIFASNVANVHKWCASNKTALILPAIEKSVREAKAGAAGPASIDVALVTCASAMKGDPEAHFIVSAWVGGYLASKRNDPKLDVRYFVRNQKAIETACAKSAKAPFLKTAQTIWK